MKKIITLLSIFITLINASILAAEYKLLYVVIDGCRIDGIQQANTPNIDTLIANGTLTEDGEMVPSTFSSAGWSSLITGVWAPKHLAIGNFFLGDNLRDYPSFLRHLETEDPSLQTEVAVRWVEITNNIINNRDADHIFQGDDEQVRTEAIDRLTNHNPDVLFVGFDYVDAAGHASGNDPSVPAYIASIETFDAALGDVLTAMKSRPDYNNENWIVMLSTDHGGKNQVGLGAHGSLLKSEKRIFTIISGEDIPVQHIKPDTTTIINSFVTNLDGSNDYISLPSNSNYNFGDDIDFTIEVMVKTNGWSGDPAIISDKNWTTGFSFLTTGGFADGFVIAGNTDGETWRFNTGDGPPFASRIDIDGGRINDGEWHHLAVSFRRDEGVILYQDGEIVGARYNSTDLSANAGGYTYTSTTNTNTVNLGNINSPHSINIGQDGTGNYEDFFDGAVREVRIWRTDVGKHDINKWSCKPLNNTHANYNDLVGYYKLNDGLPIAKDYSPIGNNGTFNGGLTQTAATESYDCIDLYNQGGQVDLVTTVFEIMGLDINPAWDLDGRSLLDIQCDTNTISLRNDTILASTAVDTSTFSSGDTIQTIITTTRTFDETIIEGEIEQRTIGNFVNTSKTSIDTIRQDTTGINTIVVVTKDTSYALDISSAIVDIASSDEISYYLTNNQTLQIETTIPIQEVSIYNIQGLSIYNKQLSQDQQHQVNLDAFPSSLYILLINTGDQIYTGKFIKL